VNRVRVSRQVAEFLSALAPEPRKRLRRSLHLLEKDQGDIKSLEGGLSGYQRLRSGSYRVILRRTLSEGHALIDCVFAEKRALVYELFAQVLHGSRKL